MEHWNGYIKEINSVIERTDYLYEKWAKQHGINSYVMQVMYIIYATGINKQKDIVGKYGMPKQTVNTVITDLQKKGYIRLTPDENDKRSKIIILTDEGRRYAENIVNPLLNCEKEVLAEMGEERVEMLISTMNQYAELLEQKMRK
ncbi:MAG: MarR family transcriptional regulator [Ruminococcus flavefaciens]|nr:MarR family transcriptional regulator [Ruminococcus flavefaciens]MCM1062330.1 MarR family transcriptional regulator [Eubacterium sp.]